MGSPFLGSDKSRKHAGRKPPFMGGLGQTQTTAQPPALIQPYYPLSFRQSKRTTQGNIELEIYRIAEAFARVWDDIRSLRDLSSVTRWEAVVPDTHDTPLEAVAAGARQIFVRRGTYTETSASHVLPSMVWIQGEDSANTVWTLANGQTLSATSINGIHLEGLTIQGDTISGLQVLFDDCDYIAFLDVAFDYATVDVSTITFDNCSWFFGERLQFLNPAVGSTSFIEVLSCDNFHFNYIYLPQGIPISAGGGDSLAFIRHTGDPYLREFYLSDVYIGNHLSNQRVNGDADLVNTSQHVDGLFITRVFMDKGINHIFRANVEDLGIESAWQIRRVRITHIGSEDFPGRPYLAQGSQYGIRIEYGDSWPDPPGGIGTGRIFDISATYCRGVQRPISIGALEAPPGDPGAAAIEVIGVECRHIRYGSSDPTQQDNYPVLIAIGEDGGTPGVLRDVKIEDVQFDVDGNITEPNQYIKYFLAHAYVDRVTLTHCELRDTEPTFSGAMCYIFGAALNKIRLDHCRVYRSDQDRPAFYIRSLSPAGEGVGEFLTFSDLEIKDVSVAGPRASIVDILNVHTQVNGAQIVSLHDDTAGDSPIFALVGANGFIDSVFYEVPNTATVAVLATPTFTIGSTLKT